MWKVVDLITREVVISEDGPSENLTREQADLVAKAYNRYYGDSLAAEVIPQGQAT